MTLIRNETAHSINGVNGRLFTLRRPPAPWKAGTFANQTWTSETRKVDAKEWGAGAVMSVDIQFDDNCNNGQNSFAITADIRIPRRRDVEACGRMHAEVKRYFPELSHLIQWHLFDTRGPMHYVANTVYLAGDRDSSGHRAGEPASWAVGYRFGNSPCTHTLEDGFFNWIESRRGSGRFAVVSVPHGPTTGYQYAPKWTFAGYRDGVNDWAYCPFDTQRAAQEFADALSTCKVEPNRVPVTFSKGKARELDAARRAANWPEATAAELCTDRAELTAALLARLPDLLARMRADIDAAGFLWECPAD